ncbi:hypothetical protein MRB53_026181 [Persea americana]|uniref:Uncharacterized protein n=1 Tax=Persea americana TaxID=3435 RepID=A0ACC2LHM3_PERAE|nr:hypothetical protein MRB53_026181 [Persea americana]
MESYDVELDPNYNSNHHPDSDSPPPPPHQPSITRQGPAPPPHTPLSTLSSKSPRRLWPYSHSSRHHRGGRIPLATLAPTSSSLAALPSSRAILELPHLPRPPRRTPTSVCFFTFVRFAIGFVFPHLNFVIPDLYMN